ncbi:hypothetical protein BU198_20750 [Streptomyces sp. CBMA156]|nr:hypothetical protein [Streptomyces sp. CBMA156]
MPRSEPTVTAVEVSRAGFAASLRGASAELSAAGLSGAVLVPDEVTLELADGTGAAEAEEGVDGAAAGEAAAESAVGVVPTGGTPRGVVLTAVASTVAAALTWSAVGTCPPLPPDTARPSAPMPSAAPAVTAAARREPRMEKLKAGMTN